MICAGRLRKSTRTIDPIETYRNVVQLSGFVSTGANMDKAVHLAGAVKGVNSVRNDLRLR